MSDEPSDPQASSAHSQSPLESVPPPAEPKTPAWLTLVGLGLVLIVLAWAAVRGSSDSAETTKSAAPGAASAQPAAH